MVAELFHLSTQRSSPLESSQVKSWIFGFQKSLSGGCSVYLSLGSASRINHLVCQQISWIGQLLSQLIDHDMVVDSNDKLVASKSEVSDPRLVDRMDGNVVESAYSTSVKSHATTINLFTHPKAFLQEIEQ